MKQTKNRLLISILLTAIHHSLISQTKEIPNTDNSDDTGPEDSELKFFQRIQSLNLDWEDITGSYKNVSAEVETELCKSKCKTTVALWVLQNLNPCDSIEKLDCPTGLICGINCGAPAPHNENIDPDKTRAQKIKQMTKVKSTGNEKAGDEPTTPMSTISFYDDTEQDIYYPEPILDPIPNDESSEILKV